MLGLLVVGTGLTGVVCSIMIYQCTSRSFWTGSNTVVKFLSTTLNLGLAAALVTALAGAGWSDRLTVRDVVTQFGRTLCVSLVVVSAAKLLFEVAFLRHLRDKLNTPAKRSASLLTGELSRVTKARFAAGLFGGLVIPALIVLDTTPGTAPGLTDTAAAALLVASFGLLLVGELCERYLFFTAVVSPRMPGGLRT
jgi:DMSO reductase anchor subunit